MATARLEENTPTFQENRRLIAGRYRTQSRIGQGRLGQIFSANDESYEKLGVERPVAIQLIPQSIVGNNHLFNKLNLGFTVLKAGAHPNIVKFLHFGRDANIGFIAMELLDGASLRQVLNGAETLPLEEVKPVVRGAGEALRLLHAKDMVHGNLTTSNIFITDDLEVRLLDVVPLDSAEAIFRGAAMSEQFGRCTVEDDVFGLACLTYEMLAGKHPFNYSPPNEARLAGLEAERIDSLTDSEWNALHRALIFEREHRTSSIANFMRELGIEGIERLRPTLNQAPLVEPSPRPVVEEIPRVIPVQRAAPAAPAVNVDPVALHENWPPNSREVEQKARPIRAVVLGMLLAGLSAWALLGEPEELLVGLIGYIDNSLDIGLTDRRNEIVAFETSNLGQPVITESALPIAASAGTSPAAAVEETPVVAESEQAEPVIADVPEESVSVLEQRPDHSEVATAPENESVRIADDETAIVETMIDETTINQATTVETSEAAAAQILPATETSSMPIQPQARMLVTEPVVTVSEGDGVARIVLQRDKSSTTPLIWWTIGNTAHVDADFIPANRQLVADASTEDGNVLHIPLINDSLAEPQESFYVYIGTGDSQLGNIEQIANVRVDIIDDDFR